MYIVVKEKQKGYLTCSTPFKVHNVESDAVEEASRLIKTPTNAEASAFLVAKIIKRVELASCPVRVTDIVENYPGFEDEPHPAERPSKGFKKSSHEEEDDD